MKLTMENKKQYICIYIFNFDHNFIKNPRIFRRRNDIKSFRWIYVLHNLQRQFSESQAFIFIFKSANDVIGLDSFGKRTDNLGPG